jgi:hypothetical protein
LIDVEVVLDGDLIALAGQCLIYLGKGIGGQIEKENAHLRESTICRFRILGRGAKSLGIPRF